jgi:hypothetical protein
MAKDNPKRRSRVWGASTTIAAIIVGAYLISLFYMNVIDGTARVGDDEQMQAQALNQH